MHQDNIKSISVVAVLAALGACGSVSNMNGVDAGADAGGMADAAIDARLSWSPLEPVTVDIDQSTMTPSVSPDGLTLLFTAYVGGMSADAFDIYVATRESPSTGFGAAAPLPNVNTPNTQQRYLELSHDGLELYFSQGDMGPIMLSTRESVDAPWSAPAPVGVSGNFPTISGDKRSLYYIAQIEGVTGEVRRITRAAPGQPWSVPSTIPMPGLVQIYSSIDISRDELSILRAPAFTSEMQGDLLIGRRQSRTDDFQEFEVLFPMQTGSTAFHSARWNADETEIWVGQAVNDVERPFVSQLR